MATMASPLRGLGVNFVVGEGEEAAVLDRGEVLVDRAGLQELFFLGRGGGAVVVDDDALRVGFDDLFP
jgi:hypothetical protein